MGTEESKVLGERPRHERGAVKEIVMKIRGKSAIVAAGVLAAMLAMPALAQSHGGGGGGHGGGGHR